MNEFPFRQIMAIVAALFVGAVAAAASATSLRLAGFPHMGLVLPRSLGTAAFNRRRIRNALI
jgi:hypothetical protein